MKTILYLVLSLALIGAVLAFPLQAAAEAVKVPITGIMTFTGEPVEDPQARLWYTPWVIHFRNDIQTFQIDSSDPRLVGWVLMTRVNGEWFVDENGLQRIHIWEKATITADPEFQDVLWNCSVNAFFSWEQIEVNYVCHGEGENQGMMLKMTGELIEGTEDQYRVEGYILETGGD